MIYIFFTNSRYTYVHCKNIFSQLVVYWFIFLKVSFKNRTAECGVLSLGHLAPSGCWEVGVETQLLLQPTKAAPPHQGTRALPACAGEGWKISSMFHLEITVLLGNWSVTMPLPLPHFPKNKREMGCKVNPPLDPSWENGYKYFVGIWLKWGKGIANKTFCF